MGVCVCVCVHVGGGVAVAHIHMQAINNQQKHFTLNTWQHTLHKNTQHTIYFVYTCTTTNHIVNQPNQPPKHC